MKENFFLHSPTTKGFKKALKILIKLKEFNKKKKSLKISLRWYFCLFSIFTCPLILPHTEHEGTNSQVLTALTVMFLQIIVNEIAMYP